jgi:hypothetical protein
MKFDNVTIKSICIYQLFLHLTTSWDKMSENHYSTGKQMSEFAP